MREGPRTIVRRTCYGCRWLHSESYRVQSDSGTDYYCTHPRLARQAERERHIGDTRTDTPNWCPVLSSSRPDIFDRLDALDNSDAAK